MIGVLVFPCASGIGQEIYNSLKYHKDITLYGANSGMINSGSIVYGEYYIGNAPPIASKDECIDWLNSVCKKYNISCIFPAYDDINVWLKYVEKELEGIKIITAPSKSTSICRSKKLTYEHFDSIIRCPKMYADSSSISGEYPLFIKPECGEGSKECYKINSYEELMKNMSENHIILEFLPGEEYTIDCFTDSNGTLSFVGPRVRKLTRAGISIITESIPDTDKEFERMAEHINKHLCLLGAWFFQVKRAYKGEICLMEIAPRISGAMFLYREQGINFPLLSIYTHMGKPTHIKKPTLSHIIGYKIYANKFFIPQIKERVIAGFYIDLDDTLLLPQTTKANPEIVSLLYEAKISDIPTYLLTRHRNTIEDTLNRACISINLFSNIIHITNSESKETYITHRPAVFMDDSFSERKMVESLDIYTFDVDACEIVRDIIRMSQPRFQITHE
jgi:hypothetical protein